MQEVYRMVKYSAVKDDRKVSQLELLLLNRRLAIFDPGPKGMIYAHTFDSQK